MILPNIQASLLRFCADYATAWVAANPALPLLTPENFDSHADESTMPQNDLVGISGLSLDIDEHVVGVRAMFGVSTLVDTNLMRLQRVMGALLERLRPKQTLPLYDADSGAVIGNMVVRNGTRLLPVGGGSSRPVQYVMTGLLSTVTA